MATRTGRESDGDLFPDEQVEVVTELRPRGGSYIKKREVTVTKPLRKLPIVGTLDHAFHIVGGREVAISMARWANRNDEQLTELLRIYDDELTPDERSVPGLLERLCLAVGLHPSDFFGRVSAAAYKHNFDVAAFTAAVAAPLVLQKATKFASKERGFKDRELLLKAARVLESSPLVTVNQTQQNVAVNGLPKLEELTGRVSDLIRGGPSPKSLPPANFVEGEIVEEVEEEAPMGFKIRLSDDEDELDV